MFVYIFICSLLLLTAKYIIFSPSLCMCVWKAISAESDPHHQKIWKVGGWGFIHCWAKTVDDSSIVHSTIQFLHVCSDHKSHPLCLLQVTWRFWSVLKWNLSPLYHHCVCRLVFVHRPKVISDYMEAQKARSVPRLTLDPECLRWTPVITRASLDEEFELAESDVSGGYLLSKLCSVCSGDGRSSALGSVGCSPFVFGAWLFPLVLSHSVFCFTLGMCQSGAAVEPPKTKWLAPSDVRSF